MKVFSKDPVKALQWLKGVWGSGRSAPWVLNEQLGLVSLLWSCSTMEGPACSESPWACGLLSCPRGLLSAGKAPQFKWITLRGGGGLDLFWIFFWLMLVFFLGCHSSNLLKDSIRLLHLFSILAFVGTVYFLSIPLFCRSSAEPSQKQPFLCC